MLDRLSRRLPRKREARPLDGQRAAVVARGWAQLREGAGRSPRMFPETASRVRAYVQDNVRYAEEDAASPTLLLSMPNRRGTVRGRRGVPW